MLVIFPFEEEIYRKAGVPATYVGHPLAEVIPMHADADVARAQLGLPLQGPVVAILPGSRMSELKYNSAAFIKRRCAWLAQRDSRSIAFRCSDGRPERQRRSHFTAALIAARRALQGLPITIWSTASRMPPWRPPMRCWWLPAPPSLEVALFKKPMVRSPTMMLAQLAWRIMRHMSYPAMRIGSCPTYPGARISRCWNCVAARRHAASAWPMRCGSRCMTPAHKGRTCVQRFTDMACIYSWCCSDTAQESAQAVL